MRNGQNNNNNNNKRMRNRNRKSSNPMTRVFESNGPDVKIRGTASHIAEKYVQLARDAQGSGDPVSAESYYQHAEHYFRLIAAAQEQFRQNNPHYRPENNEGMQQDGDDEGDDGYAPFGAEPGFAPQPPQQNFQPRDQQRDPQREPQPNFQPREQNFNRPQPNPQNDDGGDVDRLPSFITGGQPQQAQPNGNGGGFDADGNYHQERQERQDRGDRGPRNNDRFNHRRRRHRHGGPRDNAPQGGGDLAPNNPNGGE